MIVKTSIKQLKTDEIKPVSDISMKLYDWKTRISCMIPYQVRHAWCEFKCLLFPRNRWATKVIPRTWADKVELIPDFLFASIIDFIEGEEALKMTVWETKKEKELLKVYNWAKTGRQAFQDKINAAYPGIQIEDTMNPESHFSKKSYEELYAEVNRLEAEYHKTETKHLTWIVKNHQILWT